MRWLIKFCIVSEILIINCLFQLYVFSTASMSWKLIYLKTFSAVFQNIFEQIINKIFLLYHELLMYNSVSSSIFTVQNCLWNILLNILGDPAWAGRLDLQLSLPALPYPFSDSVILSKSWFLVHWAAVCFHWLPFERQKSVISSLVCLLCFFIPIEHI